MDTPPPRSPSAPKARVDALVERLLTLDWGPGREGALEAWRREVFEAAHAWPPTPALRHRIGNLLSPAVTHAYLLSGPHVPASEREDLRARIERAVEAAVHATSGATDLTEPIEPSPRAPSTRHGASGIVAEERCRVLVVDDEAPVLRAVERFLRGSRFHCHGFAEPALAIEAFARDPAAWDLALIDWDMPTMTGASLAVALRSLRPGLPVVFATGHLLEDADLRARGLERCAVVEKPLDPGALADLLEGCLRCDP